MDVKKLILVKYLSYLSTWHKRKINMKKTNTAARQLARKKRAFELDYKIIEILLEICRPRYGREWETLKINKGALPRMWDKFGDNRWFNNFRMTKRTFLFVCSLVEEELAPSEIQCSTREPLSVIEQVAIALYNLASYSEYRVVAEVFGVGKTTVHKCLHRFVNALNKRAKEFINFPDANECKKIAKKFERISNVPQVIGCIDGCHIPILPPKVGYRDYVNRKGWASYVLQAVVDCNYK